MYKRFIVGLLTLFFSHLANAVLTIEITEGVEGTMPIAVVPFKWLGSGQPPEDIADIVRIDLTRSGKFNPLPEKDMLAKPSSRAEIQFQNWRILDIPNLVIGRVWPNGDKGYFVEYRMFDVYKARQIQGFRYAVQPGQMRKIAHQISDKIYEELIGERGAFDTKIAYIKQLPKAQGGKYVLYIADSDTVNEQAILTSKSPILSPTWSPDARKLAIVLTGHEGPSIWEIDIYKGDKHRITPRGMKFSAPAWSPDGNKMAMMRAETGSTDIYVMDLGNKRLKQITTHWSIDAEPAWSPDGKKIVFTSERGGSAQLYQFEMATSKIKRLTFEGRQNLRASFSPDGKMLTFVHLDNDRKYNIAVMDLATNYMRLVTQRETEESEHESPSFAPNGSMIIYAANYSLKNLKTKKTALSAVSVDGRFHQRFIDETGLGEVREPAWSTFLN